MPLRFECEHCGQRLSIGTRMAGKRICCPTCQRSLLVRSDGAAANQASDAAANRASEAANGPSVDELASAIDAATTVRPPAFPPAPASSPPADPLIDGSAVAPPHFSPQAHGDGNSGTIARLPVIRLDKTVWVDEQPQNRSSPAAHPHYVAVPRAMLYGVAGLLAVVGVTAFVLGWVWGATFAGRRSSDLGPVACEVRGDVHYARGTQPPAVDDGAAVLIVPSEAAPSRDDRIRSDQLGPLQAPPAANDSAILALRQMGGDYARVNARGQYRLRVPDKGRYYLLVISANRIRPPDQEIDKSDLSEIGAYFRPALDLLGQQQFQWRVLRVDRDREVSVVF